MKMNEKIREYIEELFEYAPKTHKVFELKEELLMNVNDKYQGLIAKGVDEEQAFFTVTRSIGDIDTLIAGITTQSRIESPEEKKERKRTAILMSVGIGLYVFAAAVFLLLGEALEAMALGIGLMIAAVATGIVVYAQLSKPDYMKQEDTVVEEFKEWQSAKSKKRQVLDAVQSVLWVCITATYLLVSFTFGSWHISWIIFIIGAALQQVVELIFKLKE
jgi:hypothetical protein